MVISGESDRITVLFDDYGYRTLAMDAVRDADILTVEARAGQCSAPSSWLKASVMDGCV